MKNGIIFGIKNYIKYFLVNKNLKKAKKNGLKVGKNLVIYSRIVFGSEPFLISIGDNVRLADGVKFITHDGGTWVINHLGLQKNNFDVFGRITVGNNVHIGLDAIIMPGVTIGDNVVIGCGAVVTRDIPNNSVAVGVPARVIETIDQYKEKVFLKGDLTNGWPKKKKKTYLLNKYSLD